mgnify:CR=1 FL=1
MNEFTLGVEEEYMVVDPVTRELTSHDQKIVESAQKIHKDQVKAEMHQAVVEVGTGKERNFAVALHRFTIGGRTGSTHWRCRNTPFFALGEAIDYRTPPLQ